MKRRKYKVRAANLYVGNPNPRMAMAHLTDGRPHVGAVCEVSPRWQEPLREEEGYRYLGKRPVGANSHGRCEVGLLIRDDVEIDSWGLEKMSDDTGEQIAHDRWAAWARVILPGGVKALAWSTHKNAGVQGKLGRPILGADRTNEYAQHAANEAAFLEAERLQGWPVLGGQDGNFRVPKGLVLHRKLAWRHAPQQSLAAIGVRFVAHGLDGVMFNKEAFRKAGRLKVIHQAWTGSDHDWLTLNLTPRNYRKS